MSSKDNKLVPFSFKVTVHRIITTKKEQMKYKLASDDKCPFCLKPDSIKHTSIYCQKSKEFFSKTLGWFKEYHKENVQPSNKQILFNTFEDSSSIANAKFNSTLQNKYLYTCKSITKKRNLDELLRTKLLEQYRIENCGKQYQILVWQLTGFYPPIFFIIIVIVYLFILFFV